MRYQTKLYVSLVSTALVTMILGLGIGFSLVRSFLLEEFRSKVMSVSAATAASIDGDMLKTVRNHNDEMSENYKNVQNKLRAVRNLNQRDDIFVKFIYTLVPKKEDPSQFYYQVDAEENTPDFSHIGDDVPDARDGKLSLHLKEIYSPPHFIKNKWGIWMTGFAPVYDHRGNYVASVGVDLRAVDVITKLDRLFEFGFLAFSASLFLALITAYFLAAQASKSLGALYAGVKRIGEGSLGSNIDLASQHDEFSDLGNAINKMAKGLQERERLRENFTRYVSQHVMESISNSEAPVKLEGERRKVTLVFSDIRQFTNLSEKLPPEYVVALLNEYFAVMVDIIFKNKGTLDKFLGDGMMIEFGVPIDDSHQEYHAVKTALQMLEASHVLSEKWKKEGKPSIEIGIGVHTGIAIVGNIGSVRRIEYTAIGDTVNVASRLQQLTKDLQVPIILSESTILPIKHRFNFKEIGPTVLRGRSDAIVVYSLAPKKRK